MNVFKRIAYSLIFHERATEKTYVKFLEKNLKSCGKNLYIVNPHKTFIDKSSLSFISIGDNVQITPGVSILGHDESYSVHGITENFYPRKQTITSIGNNVFIGMNATILMGAQIGDNVIIGAGSVVRGTVESNSVYFGNPAKRIMSIKEHYEHLYKDFEISAYTFIKTFKEKNNRYPSENELSVYSILFEGMELKEDVNKSKEIVDSINSRKINKYKDFDEFIKKYEEK